MSTQNKKYITKGWIVVRKDNLEPVCNRFGVINFIPTKRIALEYMRLNSANASEYFKVLPCEIRVISKKK